MTGRCTHLECSECQRRYEADRPAGLCECGRPLLARYDTDRFDVAAWRQKLASRPHDMWRYREMLPDVDVPVTLGEGYTPLLEVPQQVCTDLGLEHVTCKWEGDNPTGSFKDRGMSMAVSRAVHLGLKRFVVPTAGNAGVSAAAYVQAAGGTIDVFLPADTDPEFIAATEAHGAHVHRIDGLITDCGRHARERVESGAFDLSTLKEPYRLEGKKTMGYELWEQLDGRLPDVIVYPTGGGTGLIGMWKAFDELEAIGAIDDQRPRMVSVQMAGCAPIPLAYEQGQTHATPWPEAQTDVLGLRVPVAVGDGLILRAIDESDGTALAISEEEAFAATDELFRHLHKAAAPEAGAAWAALRRLREQGELTGPERIVVFLTGNGLLYRNILERHGLAHIFAAPAVS